MLQLCFTFPTRLLTIQVICFGANDACLKDAPGSQHVPLDRFKQNLIDMVTHPIVKRHNPRIVLVTPPAMNEYAVEENDRIKGYLEPRRKANHTKLYAEAVCEVAKELDVAVLDFWSLLMTQAGWKEGDYPLPGSKELPPNMHLRMLLHDGESSHQEMALTASEHHRSQRMIRH